MNRQITEKDFKWPIWKCSALLKEMSVKKIMKYHFFKLKNFHNAQHKVMWEEVNRVQGNVNWNKLPNGRFETIYQNFKCS